MKIQCVKFLFRLAKREAVAICKSLIHPDVKIKYIQYDSLQDFSIYTIKQYADLFKAEEYTTQYFIVLFSCLLWEIPKSRSLICIDGRRAASMMK